MDDGRKETSGLYEELLKKRDAAREAKADKREPIDLDQELRKLELIKV